MNDPAKPPLRKSHRLSAAVYATTDYEYHFTVCARHQGQPFTNEQMAESVIDSLLWTRTKRNWLLFCFCLMPDHLHFVCRLTDKEVRLINHGVRGYQPEGILDHLANFKSYTTNQSWRLGFQGKLWQKGSYDRVIDLDWPFGEVVEYVLNNPVRKGLVRNWQDWKYSQIVDQWW
ncbi:MAG: transposase [Pirellulales bacterium]